MLLVSGRVSVPKPLSQIQRSTRWLLQGLSPKPSFGGFGLSGNYDYLRRQLRSRSAGGADGKKLFIGSGVSDQRGVYGDLNTLLFHREMDRRGIDHLYCTYQGTHSDVAWVRAMPLAFEFLLSESPRERAADGTTCVR